MLCKVFEYSPSSVEGKDIEILESSLICVACLDVWVATGAFSLTENKESGDIWEKLYTDTHKRLCAWQWGIGLEMCVRFYSTGLGKCLYRAHKETF